ncbi:MAG: sulfotransferase [Woeseia sp.]
MKKIVYILSDNRSGSTLLDQLLGAHDRMVSLGEIHHLPAYVLQDRTLYNPAHPLDCSCGKPIGSCPFWSTVEHKLGRSFATLRLRLPLLQQAADRRGAKRLLGTAARRLVRQHPRLFLSPFASPVFRAGIAAADSFDLFDAIFNATGADYLIDSSKDPFRFRALYDFAPTRVLGIMLGRDYRGAVYSKMKRGRDLRHSIDGWVMRMRQMKVLTDGVQSRQLLQLRYEDLCRDPRSELGRICDFLSLDYSDSLLTRPSVDVHHLGGSPSKFDLDRKSIALDQSYLDAFNERDLATMREIAGDIATEWGYT